MEINKYPTWKDRCFNPLNKNGHKFGISTRRVSDSLRLKFPTIPESSKICDSCRKELSKLKDLPSSNERNESSNVDFHNFESEEIILNDDLNSDSEESKNTPKRNDKYQSAGVEVLNQIKEKLKSSTSKAEKFQLLTLAPKSYSRNELMPEFGISDRLARKVKKLVQEQGILSLPNPKKEKPLNPETEILVKNFYESDDISRLLPGVKDCMSVKINDKKVLVQKRLILCNLNELYDLFKTQYPDVKLAYQNSHNSDQSTVF